MSNKEWDPREIESLSSLAAAQRCKRNYYWRYQEKLIPIDELKRDWREFGSIFHDAVEVLRTREDLDPFQTIVDKWAPKKSWEAEEDCARCLAAFHWYMETWGKEGSTEADFLDSTEWEVVEGQLKADIANSHNVIHPSRVLWGRLDGIVRVHERCEWGGFTIEQGRYLYELKTKNTIDHSQLDRLEEDDQLLLYCHHVRNAFDDGVPFHGALYDVVTRAKTINRRKAESQEDFDERKKKKTEKLFAQMEEAKDKASRGELKGRIKKKNSETDDQFMKRAIEASRLKLQELETEMKAEIAGLRPKKEESLDAFKERLNKHFEEGDKDKRFARKFVPMRPEKMNDCVDNLYMETLLIDHCAKTGIWPKNGRACHDFGRECDYLKICSSLDNPAVIDGEYRRKSKHARKETARLDRSENFALSPQRQDH